MLAIVSRIKSRTASSMDMRFIGVRNTSRHWRALTRIGARSMGSYLHLPLIVGSKSFGRHGRASTSVNPGHVMQIAPFLLGGIELGKSRRIHYGALHPLPPSGEHPCGSWPSGHHRGRWCVALLSCSPLFVVVCTPATSVPARAAGCSPEGEDKTTSGARHEASLRLGWTP